MTENTETTDPVLKAMWAIRDEHWTMSDDALTAGNQQSADTHFAMAAGITAAIRVYIENKF